MKEDISGSLFAVGYVFFCKIYIRCELASISTDKGQQIAIRVYEEEKLIIK